MPYEMCYIKKPDLTYLLGKLSCFTNIAEHIWYKFVFIARKKVNNQLELIW